MTTTPRTHMFAGSLLTWHATAEDTGGAYSMAEAYVPAGAEPPVHVHAREDEVYYVLEGEVTFQRGLEIIEASAGDSVVLPRGLQHGFAVRSGYARVLFVASPGGIEHAFLALGSEAAAGELPGPPSGPPPAEAVAAMTAAFGEKGIEFTGPPLAVLLTQA
jgi:quercetin dioxygenase-like cupin family protein